MLRQSGSDYLENGGTSCASLQDQVPPTDKSDRKLQESKSSGLLKLLILSLVAVQEHGHDVPICSQHSALPFVFFRQMPLLVQTTTQTCPMPNAWLLLVGCWRRFICNSVSSFIAVGSLSTMGQSLYRNDGFTYPQDTLRNDYKAINLAQKVSCFQDMCSMPCFFLAHGVEIHENTMALSLSHGTTWRELQGSESEVKPTCHPAIETLGMQTSRVVAWCFGQPLP